jgi:lysine 2,3-aminomutase
MRGFTSGLAIPQLVVDTEGGGGKVPINPDYIVNENEKEILLQNYEGKLFRYQNPFK